MVSKDRNNPHKLSKKPRHDHFQQQGLAPPPRESGTRVFTSSRKHRPNHGGNGHPEQVLPHLKEAGPRNLQPGRKFRPSPERDLIQRGRFELPHEPGARPFNADRKSHPYPENGGRYKRAILSQRETGTRDLGANGEHLPYPDRRVATQRGTVERKIDPRRGAVSAHGGPHPHGGITKKEPKERQVQTRYRTRLQTQLEFRDIEMPDAPPSSDYTGHLRTKRCCSSAMVIDTPAALRAPFKDYISCNACQDGSCPVNVPVSCA